MVAVETSILSRNSFSNILCTEYMYIPWYWQLAPSLFLRGKKKRPVKTILCYLPKVQQPKKWRRTTKATLTDRVRWTAKNRQSRGCVHREKKTCQTWYDDKLLLLCCCCCVDSVMPTPGMYSRYSSAFDRGGILRKTYFWLFHGWGDHRWNRPPPPVPANLASILIVAAFFASKHIVHDTAVR